MGSASALCCVCKADLNTSAVRDNAHTPPGMAAGQNVCGAVDEAGWSDVSTQHAELKREELEPSTSGHLCSDPDPVESRSSPHTPLNGEEQHLTHTSLASVTLVACRSVVELNRNVTREEHLSDGTVHAEEAGEPEGPGEPEEAGEPEEPGELEEPDEASDDFCPLSKSGLYLFFVFLINEFITC